MRWPWSKKRQTQTLKHKLRAQARRHSGSAGFEKQSGTEPPTPQPSEQVLEDPRATDKTGFTPAHKQHEPRQHPPPERQAQAKTAPAEPEAKLPKYEGIDLTLFVRKRGRAVAFGQRPRPKVKPAVQEAALPILSGTDLTLFYARKGRRRGHSLIGRIESRRLLPSIGAAVIGTLRWLFLLKPKILVIERYVWTECFGHFLLGAMGFTFFMIITTVFTLSEKIFSKNIPPYTVAKVLMLSAPWFLVLAIPVAVIFSTLMAMGRLSRDNEIIACQTSGISLYRIFVPFLSVAVFAGILTWFVYEHVVPPNNKEYKDVLKVFWEAQVVDFIKPGIIIKAPDRKYFYVDEVNRTEGVMYNIRLYDYFKDDGTDRGRMRNFPRIFIADRAFIQEQFLVLVDVKVYNLDANNGDSLVCATMPEVRIDISPRISEYPLPPHPTELEALELRNRLAQLRERIAALTFPNPGLQKRYLQDCTEYYFKYSIPFACIALVLVAVPVSLRGPRDERNLGIILTFILVMIYYVVFFICRVLGARGIIVAKGLTIGSLTLLSQGANLFPPIVAGWLAPAAFLAAAVVLILRARK